MVSTDASVTLRITRFTADGLKDGVRRLGGRENEEQKEEEEEKKKQR